MESKLSQNQMNVVAMALFKEYAWMGVTYEAALSEVRTGKWDRHPIAVNFIKKMERNNG